MSWVQTVPISGEGCSSSSTWSADQRLCCRFSKKKGKYRYKIKDKDKDRDKDKDKDKDVEYDKDKDKDVV